MDLDGFVPPWIAIVPIKELGSAKGRLTPALGSDRASLAQAMAQDTVAALRASPSIQAIVLVQEGDATPVVADCETVLGPNRGLNDAIAHAADVVAGREREPYHLVIVPADLPCLTGDALETILHAAANLGFSMVSDTVGTGTTLLLVTDGRRVPTHVHPRYGEHSCAAHVADGATNLCASVGSDPALDDALMRARRDVDTAVDLWDAQRIGVGTATRRLMN